MTHRAVREAPVFAQSCLPFYEGPPEPWPRPGVVAGSALSLLFLFHHHWNRGCFPHFDKVTGSPTERTKAFWTEGPGGVYIL